MSESDEVVCTMFGSEQERRRGGGEGRRMEWQTLNSLRARIDYDREDVETLREELLVVNTLRCR